MSPTPTDPIRRRLLVAAGAAAATCGASARAAAWPTRPVTLVVPFPAGGPTDIVGRIVAEGLSARLGQQVVVDNRAGAAGAIGAAAVARAAPDGHTLGVATVSTHGTIPALAAKPPYDPMRDFTAVSMLATSPMSLSVHPSLPVRTVAEFVAHVREHPGRLAYGNAGAGGIGDLGMLWFLQQVGGSMVSVPYKGSAPMLTDLAGGQVQAAFDNFPSSLAQMRAGRIRGLALTGRARSPALPELPTFAEAGHPAFDVQAWYGLVAPPQVPAPIVERLADEIGRLVGDASIAARLADAGAVPSPNRPAEHARQIRDEVERWQQVARTAGLKPQ
jgi:tripartite-type tricarboxylate transporter receptor subunit TctC